MSGLSLRVGRLEAANNPNGPALVTWWFNDHGRAATHIGGATLTQRDAESVDEFLDRAASSVPTRKDSPLIWVSELDARL